MGFLESLTGDLLEFLRQNAGRYGYVLLFLFTFLETSAFLGLLAPGEATVVICGLFASRGPLALGPVIALAVVGSFLGDNAGYWIGRRFGTGLLERYGKYVFFHREDLAEVRRFYRAHGGKTVLLGRYMTLVRSFGPVVAGSSHMPYGGFALWSAVGCATWGTAFALMGYFFGESWDIIERYMGRVGLIASLAGFTLIGSLLLWRRRRKKKHLSAGGGAS